MIFFIVAATALTPTPPLSNRPLTRSAFLQTSALLVTAAPLWPAVADDEPQAVAAPAAAIPVADVVMRGQLQMTQGLASKLPAGCVASVAIRVVGRNTKGPLATIQVPLEGKGFPIDYTVVRSNLREGVPDFLWAEEDIYVFSQVLRPDGKSMAEGRSKAKYKPEEGKPSRQVAYLSLE